MTNEQILKLAIEKAKGNGWITNIISVNPGYEHEFIFRHDFAKAFWGECSDQDMAAGSHNCWSHHLQQMVLEENPLKYLEKFLKEKNI